MTNISKGEELVNVSDRSFSNENDKGGQFDTTRQLQMNDPDRVDPAFLKIKMNKKSTHEDSDNDGVLFEKDASNGLSYQKLVFTLNTKHPREVSLDETLKMNYKKWPICRTTTGRHSYGKKQRKSDLQEYGVGITLYFMFLKYIGCMFFMMILLSIPSCMMFFSANTSFEYQFKDLVLKMSLGNVNSIEQACNTGSFENAESDTIQTDSKTQINMLCRQGQLSSLASFGSLGSNSYVTCSDHTGSNYNETGNFDYLPDTCSMDSFEQTYLDKINGIFDADCKGKQYCAFTFKESDLPTSECIQAPSTIANYQYVVIATCESNTITIGGNDFSVTKPQMARIIVICDLLVSYFLYFNLLALKKHQEMVKQDIDETSMVAPEFTVQLKQNPHKEDIDTMIPIYWSWAEYVLDLESSKLHQETKNNDLNMSNVANVNLGLNDYGYLKHYQKMAKMLKKKKFLDAKFKLTESEQKKQKIESQIQKLQKSSIKIFKDIEQFKSTNKSEAIYVYLQFQSMNGKKQFMKAFKDYGKCRRCCIQSCQLCGKRADINPKYLAGYWPEPVSATDPTLILWQNLGYGTLNKFCRRVFIYLLSFLIISVSFAVIIYSYQLQDDFQSKGFDANACGSNTITFAQAQEDHLKEPEEQQDLTGCYCYQQFLSINIEVRNIKWDDGTDACTQWLTLYTFSLSIIYGIAAFISILNGVLRQFLRHVSKFEKAHTITEQLASSSTKMWIVQFVNTGIVLLLINAKIEKWKVPKGLPILNGDYPDFNAEWYATIGTTIAFSMFFSAVMPLTNFLFSLQKFLVNCIDRKCTLNRQNTRQLLQTDYEAKYIGSQFQIENRYAQIISIVFITMLYSSAIPFLYFAALLAIFFMYWSDKILFLRNWKTPPVYGDNLAVETTKILQRAVIMHMCFGFYMISNPDFFEYESNSWFTSRAQSRDRLVFNWMNVIFGIDPDRFYQTHVLIYLAGLIIFLVIFIIEEFTGVISKLVSGCCCCFDKQTKLEDCKNLFKEISVQALQHEYDSCAQKGQEIYKPDEKRPYMLYYITRLSYKLRQIKQVLKERMVDVRCKVGKDTQENFTNLFVQTKDDQTHKIKTQHSYNILDHPDYIESQKIEKRVISYKLKTSKHAVSTPNSSQTNTNVQSNKQKVAPVQGFTNELQNLETI